MFDNTISTQTTTTSSTLTVVVKPNQICNSVAFLNLYGNTLQIKANDGTGGAELYNKTILLDGSIITDWYSYFFESFDIRNAVVLTDIPVYSNVVFTLTITGTTPKIGSFIYGNVVTIGSTQMGVGLGIVDYSTKASDEYGNTTFVERAFSKRMEPQVYVDNSKLRYVNKTLEEIRAIPTVWIGSEDEMYDPLVIFGFFKDYSISISYPTVSMLSLTIEGLI